MDYGYVVGTFIRPLGAPAPTDRGAHGTVRLIPHDVRKLDSPSRETGKINETLTMDAAGHVEGWFVTGVYSVSVVYCDGTRRPMFDVRVEATHTVASPLDLVTAAPPIPSPEVVVIVSEAERIRAEQAAEEAEAAAERAEAAASEIEPPFEFTQLSDLGALTEARVGVWHYIEGIVYDPPVPEWFDGIYGDYSVSISYADADGYQGRTFSIQPYGGSQTLFGYYTTSTDGSEEYSNWGTDQVLPTPYYPQAVLGVREVAGQLQWDSRYYYFREGYGSPQGVVADVKGMIYIDQDYIEGGTLLWVNSDSGANNRWIPLAPPQGGVQTLTRLADLLGADSGPCVFDFPLDPADLDVPLPSLAPYFMGNQVPGLIERGDLAGVGYPGIFSLTMRLVVPSQGEAAKVVVGYAYGLEEGTVPPFPIPDPAWDVEPAPASTQAILDALEYQVVQDSRTLPATGSFVPIASRNQRWQTSREVNAGVKANTIPQRDGNGDLLANYLGTPSRLVTSNELVQTVLAGGFLRKNQYPTPASPTSTGIANQVDWDADYLYICIATNTWKRIPLDNTW